MRRIILFVVIFGLVCISNSRVFAMTYLYASPSGSGTGLSIEDPASLAGVKTLAQSYVGTDNVTIYLRGGTYQLISRLEFGPADSGQNGYVVLWRNYPGDEKVILSGGVQINGWTLHDTGKNIWRASVPAGYKSRQLWVNGEKAERTRWVNGTFVPTTSLIGPMRRVLNDASFPDLSYPNDIELHAHGRSTDFYFWRWRHNFYGVTNVAKDGDVTTFTLAAGAQAAQDIGYNMIVPGPMSWIENAYEFLNSSTKGQYFFPSTEDYIYYVPRDGEDMANVDTWIPHPANIIFSSSGLANITFFGLSFQHAGWIKPTTQGSFIDLQANHYLDASTGYKLWLDDYQSPVATFPKAAVEIHGGNNVKFLQCEFKHLGGQGLKFGLGTVNSAIIGNVFTDIAAAGIHIGSAFYKDAHPSTGIRTSDLMIQSNLIYDIGNQYSGAPGIFVGFGEYIKVKNNIIHNTPYTGISIGWGWDYMTQMWHNYNDYDYSGLGFIDYSNNNEVAYNLIYDVMQELFDGGAIYTLGEQAYGAIYGNYIYNVGNFYDTSIYDLHLKYHPIYCDEGTRYMDVYSNLVLKPEVDGPNKWVSANLLSSYSDFSLRDNFFEFGLGASLYYGSPGTNTNNTAIVADPSTWPAPAKAIANGAGTELLIAGDVIENAAVIYGWKEHEGDIIDIEYGTYTLSGYEEPDPFMWRAVVSDVTDGLAQLQVTSNPYDPEACGGSYSLSQDTWRQISLPCKPVNYASTVTDLFADDFTGDYNKTWILYERDEVNDIYKFLSSDSPLRQGQGYWIFTTESNVSLDMTGISTPLKTSPECPGGCYEIALTPTDSFLFNMPGHPFPYDVEWADVRVSVGGVLYDLSAAETAGYLANRFYTYNGNCYETYDDATPGMIGVLEAYEGIWVKMLQYSSSVGDITLLIPPDAGSFSSLNLNNSNEKQLAASNSTWLGRWYDWIVPKANAASINTNQQNPLGQNIRDMHREEHRKSIEDDNEEWVVRLIIEAPDEGLIDRNNVFGQLRDSKRGYDEHDLEELPPFGDKYLTIVFPHHDWDDKANDYASDFHTLNSRKGKDKWEFEVRTNDPNRELSLSWSGPEDILQKSQLIDEETGEVIIINPGEIYSFIIGSTYRRFTWEYSSKF